MIHKIVEFLFGVVCLLVAVVLLTSPSADPVYLKGVGMGVALLLFRAAVTTWERIRG